MMTHMKLRFKNTVPFICGFLFSVNCVWLVLRHDLLTLPANSLLLGQLVNHSPYKHLHTYLYSRLGHFYVNLADCIFLSLLVGAILFVALSLLAPFSVTDTLLKAGGVLAFVGFPLVRLFWYPVVERVHAVGFFEVETILVLVCIVLYLYRRWSISPGIMLCFLALHVGLWSWATDSYVGWNGLIFPFRSGDFPSQLVLTLHIISYPLLGFPSSLAWAAYIAQQDDGQNSEEQQIIAPARP